MQLFWNLCAIILHENRLFLSRITKTRDNERSIFLEFNGTKYNWYKIYLRKINTDPERHRVHRYHSDLHI